MRMSLDSPMEWLDASLDLPAFISTANEDEVHERRDQNQQIHHLLDLDMALCEGEEKAAGTWLQYF